MRSEDLKNFIVPTGNICIMQGDKGKLEFVSLHDYGKAKNERLKEENYQLQKDCQICENFIDFIPCKPIRDMDYDLQMVINERDKYIQTLQEIKEKCNEARRTGRKAYLPIDILDAITKAEEE